MSRSAEVPGELELADPETLDKVSRGFALNAALSETAVDRASKIKDPETIGLFTTYKDLEDGKYPEGSNPLRRKAELEAEMKEKLGDEWLKKYAYWAESQRRNSATDPLPRG